MLPVAIQRYFTLPNVNLLYLELTYPTDYLMLLGAILRYLTLSYAS